MLKSMSLEALDPDEVLALHYDGPSVAADLAHWCEGGLVGDVLVLVGRDGGTTTAHVGDWLVRHADNGYEVLSAAAFAQRYGPETG